MAQVARSLDPTADVAVGTWVNGPDGRRDLDVLVRLAGAGVRPALVIECKDWNRPIGIGFIDALESKRRDLGASAAIICSNSGFTADALRKAARVGIPALSALIEGDRRVRVVVRQQIYTRIVHFTRHAPLFHHQRLSAEAQASMAAAGTNEFAYEGKSLEAWVSWKLLQIAGMASRSRSFVTHVKCRHPVQMQVRGVDLLITKIDIRAAFTVQWMTQVAEIGASQGMYDYLRGVVIVGAGPHQIHLKNVNSETWGSPVPIENVPPRLLIPFDQRQGPGVPFSEMTLALIENMPQSDPKDAPNFEPFVYSEETVDDIQAETVGSQQ